MLFVADASALLAYLRRESGGEMLRDLLAGVSTTIYMHAVNLCEVYYDVLRSSSALEAASVILSLYEDGVMPRTDCDEAFWMEAGTLKVVPGRLSLADCFAVALARRENCELLTADHHEMDKLIDSGIARIRFIR